MLSISSHEYAHELAIDLVNGSNSFSLEQQPQVLELLSQQRFACEARFDATSFAVGLIQFVHSLEILLLLLPSFRFTLQF